MINVISQSLRLDVVNINAYAKFYQKDSKRFKSYRHFSRTGWGQNLHKLSGDKIKCLIIGHSVKVNLQFQLTFLGSCNYLGVVLTSGGSFIQASKTLADKALQAMYCLFECLKGTKLPVNMLNLFDSKVASILNYGVEVWGFISAEGIERVHSKFCKRVLNVKLSTNNYGIYKELGRYPLFITRQIRIVKYWLNLATNTNSNCILPSVYSCMERQIAENINQATWLSKVKHLLTRNGFGDVWQFPESVSAKLFLAVLKTGLIDNYLQELRERLTISIYLTLHRELNANFEISPYLKILCYWKHRTALAKLRLSSHSLNIGRHHEVPREERKCIYCNSNDEDEFHFIFKCPLYNELREIYISRYYYTYPSMLKFIDLLNCTNVKRLKT